MSSISPLSQAGREESSSQSGDGAKAVLTDDLGRRFGQREVLRHVDIALDQGERLALRGPNGSGKTTILRCVAGTITPTAGQITVFGHAAGSREARRLIGVSLSQDRSFYMRLSGRENLVFAAGIRGVPRSLAAGRAAALEEELELAEILSQRVDRCSTGMIQQLAFARALIGEPRVLLLDEPTRSLDEQAYERLWGALDARPHLTILLATHREDDALRCHRQLELDVLAPDRD